MRPACPHFARVGEQHHLSLIGEQKSECWCKWFSYRLSPTAPQVKEARRRAGILPVLISTADWNTSGISACIGDGICPLHE